MRQFYWILTRDFSDQLDRIERRLIAMSDMETRLDEVLATVSGTVGQVVDLVGQVLAKLQEAGAGVDLSDETTTLTNLQADLQGAVDRMQASVGGSTPPAEPTTPPTEPTTPV
jgi:hypothetical protein